MGLDFVEITISIEEKLGVELSEDDVRSVTRDNDLTVGALYELLLRKLHLRDAGRHDFALNHALWLQMQQILSGVTASPLEAIRLETPLDRLLPRESRREKWTALQETCPYRIAELDYPRLVRVCGLMIAATVVVVELFQVWQIPGAQWLWPVLGILGCWMVSETYLKVLSICRPFRNELPRRMSTVKDLCRTILALNYSEICANWQTQGDNESLSVWEQLVEILSETLGVEPDQLTFSTRLVRDLRME